MVKSTIHWIGVSPQPPPLDRSSLARVASWYAMFVKPEKDRPVRDSEIVGYILRRPPLLHVLRFKEFLVAEPLVLPPVCAFLEPSQFVSA